MKKRITQDDYIKANRKASREAEIEMYGHPICHQRVHQSKKVYRDIPKIIKFKATNSLRVSCLFCIFKHSPQKTV